MAQSVDTAQVQEHLAAAIAANGLEVCSSYIFFFHPFFFCVFSSSSFLSLFSLSFFYSPPHSFSLPLFLCAVTIQDWEFWMEPGRRLVAGSGVLLARVTQIKHKVGHLSLLTFSISVSLQFLLFV
jgi:hypothetical protein